MARISEPAAPSGRMFTRLEPDYMPLFLQLILTLVIAALGGWVGLKLRIPAGTLLGALLFTVLYNLIFEQAYVPRDFRPWLQMLAGILIGSSIQRRDVRELKHLVIPCVIMIVNMIILNLVFGYLVYRFSTLDLITSLLATAPGGMTDMSLIAAELGGEMIPVTVLHLVRLLVILALLPLIFSRLRRYQQSNGHMKQTDKPDQSKPIINKKQPSGQRQTFINLSLTCLAAAAGGILLWQLGVNAGAMIGSMLGVAALNLATNRARSPAILRRVIQTLAGAFIGQSMTRDNLSLMIDLVVPVLIMAVSVVFFLLLISLSLIWLSKLERATCILASAPGGLQELSIIAGDLNADAPKVMVMHTTRLMVVIALFPTLLTAAARFFT
jgi:uncharacterized protein